LRFSAQISKNFEIKNFENFSKLCARAQKCFAHKIFSQKFCEKFFHKNFVKNFFTHAPARAKTDRRGAFAAVAKS